MESILKKINSTETIIRDNKFDGKFVFNDVTMCESIRINFYNLNNFWYGKYFMEKK